MTPILIQSLQLHDDFTTLLMNMIFAELIMALFGVPVNFTAAIQHGWKLGETFCHAHGFLLTLESKYKFSTLLSYSLLYSTPRHISIRYLHCKVDLISDMLLFLLNSLPLHFAQQYRCLKHQKQTDCLSIFFYGFSIRNERNQKCIM